MKITYLSNYIFKNDEHTGKKSLSVLGWSLIGLLVISVCVSYLNPSKRKGVLDSNGKYINTNEIFNVINGFDEEDNLEVITAENQFLPKSEVDKGVPISIIDHTHPEIFQSLPYGSVVRCILINRIVSNNFSSPVVSQVKESFYFNDQLLLPKGTRIYGEAKKGLEDDRILVAFHRIVFQSGQEILINGRGLSEDLSGGLQAIIINNENKKRVVARILDFIGGTLVGLQDNATNALTGVAQVENSSRNSLLEGGATAFNKESERIEKSIEQAQGKGIVPEGTEIYIFFDERLSLAELKH